MPSNLKCLGASLVLLMWGNQVSAEKQMKIIPFSELDRSKPIPRSSPSTWFTVEDARKLPPLTGGATTSFTLSVDETGAVVKCTVETSSGSPTHDQALCGTLMMRVQFVPALDKQGNKVPSVWRNRIKW